jgi:hypothetical protein
VPPVLDDDEAVKELKRQCGHSEEGEGNDHLSMLGEKRKPLLTSISTTRPQTAKIPGNGAFRDLKTQLQ